MAKIVERYFAHYKMNNMEMMSAWKESTQKIFWGVIVIAVAGIFNTVYDYVSLATNVMGQLSGFMPGGMDRGISSFLAALNGTGIAVKGAIVVGYLLYLVGLKQFAGIQSNALAAQNILKVRTAVIILISCFVVSVVFGILFKLPGIGLLITIGVWIATLVAYFKMKNAFGVLMTSPAFSEQSQKGAKKLRFAAVCNIWVMLLPIIAVILVALFFLSVVSGMSSGGRDLDTLMYSGGVLLALMAVCAIILLIIALINPFIGWYKIMKGGPGGDSYANEELASGTQEQIENEQQAVEQQSPYTQSSNNVQQLSDKVQMPYENVKQSFDKAWQAAKPKLESAQAWTAANKSKVAIGTGVVALAALLIWLVPKLFDGGPVEFEKYELQGDTICINGASTEIWVSFDIPQSSGGKQKNVEKAMRELISQSKLAREMGAPVEGSLKEVAEDYVKRFLESAAKSDEYGATRCDLGIISGYQNESSVTIHFIDGLYGNGGPQESDYVVRLSDGHIMQQHELMQISDDRLLSLIKKYVVDGYVTLSDGYCISPMGVDSCKVLWQIGSHLNGEVIVPISELEPFMTEEGKVIFKAKPVDIVAKEITVEEEVTEDVEQEYEIVPTSEMVVFENGKLGPVQVGKPISKLPKSVEWLYDHYEYKKIEHEGNDMDDPWTEEYYLFTKGGKEVFRANINENKVYSIRLLKGSSFIRTTDGITVGFSARGLIMIKRLDWTNYYDGEVFGTEGNYSYYINPDDLVRTDIPKKNEDLKPEAKVIAIEYSAGIGESQPEPVGEKEKPEKPAVNPQSSYTVEPVKPAPPKDGENTVNLNQLIQYTNKKK